MRAQRRTSGPGAWRGMAGFARHALVFRSRRLHDLDQEMQEIQEIQERPCGGALFSVAVEGLALWACTLCSPFSGARQRPSMILVY